MTEQRKSSQGKLYVGRSPEKRGTKKKDRTFQNGAQQEAHGCRVNISFRGRRATKCPSNVGFSAKAGPQEGRGEGARR